MREYVVRKINLEDAEAINIDIAPWGEYPYIPETKYYIVHDGKALIIKMQTNEKNLRAVMTEQNSAVCQDSCMELFIRPNKDDDRYFNFEINPITTLHLGLGEGRHNRTRLPDKDIFEIKSVIENGIWTVTFKIPFDFLEKHIGFTKECYANFYKCGEGTDHSHFCVWNNIEVEKPDFHQSAFFGKLTIE